MRFRGLLAGNIRHFGSCIVTFGSVCALARLATGTRACGPTATRCRLDLSFFLDGDFGWRAVDHRLRTRTVFDYRCRNLGGFLYLRCNCSLGFGSLRLGGTFATLSALATFRAILAAITTLTAVAAVFTRLLVLATIALLDVLLAALLRLLFLDRRLRSVAQIVAVAAVHIILIDRIAVTILEFAALLMLEAILHLGLRRCDNAIVMFCVLQIVLRHHAVARTLGIAGKSRIFFCNMLGSTADFYIRSGTVVRPAERVTALALEIVITTTAAVIVTTTPSTTLVLLSWPHLSFTNSLVFADKGPRGSPV